MIWASVGTGNPKATARILAASVLTFLGILSAPVAACGQGIMGRVVDAEADTGIAAVAVTLVDTAGNRLTTVSTDSTGAFGLPVYSAGIYTLNVRHVAYEEVDTRPLDVERRDVVHVDIRLSRLTFDLDPLVVTARARAPTSYLREYYDRLDRHQKSGWGVILTREELEPLAGHSVGDLLMRPTLTGRFLNRRIGGRCPPMVYWNGLPVPVDQIPVSSVEGIEIYRGTQVPARYGGYHPCGVVLVWSRAIRPGEGRRLDWSGAVIAAVAGVLMFIMAR